MVQRLGQTNQPQQTEATRPPRSPIEPDQARSTFPAPLPSAKGHRVI
jgi:hypothetical protein